MTILVKLGRAYYNQGFVNIPTRCSDFFGSNLSEIKVFLNGENSNPLTAYINRTAQATKSPRIMMGYSFTKWVQSKYKLGDTIKIELLCENINTSILIR